MKTFFKKTATLLLACLLSFSYIISTGAGTRIAMAEDLSQDTSSDDTSDSADDTSTEEPADITDPSAPSIVANAAIVIDAKTGAVLYGKNMDRRCYPASITKVMTCLVALDHTTMTDTITFSENAIWGIERDSNHIALDVGEQISVEDCFYAILLQSANEASIGMAEHVAGSVEAFADMMNEEAQAIGATNSHFVNPHGLNAENHYVTAYDMYLIFNEALKYDTVNEIISMTSYDTVYTDKNGNEKTLSAVWGDASNLLNGIDRKIYTAEIALSSLYASHKAQPIYKPLPKFPAVTRDLSLVCDRSVPVAELDKAIRSVKSRIIEDVKLFDVYEGDRIAENKKSVAYSLILRAEDRTLTDDECSDVVGKVIKALSEIGAELRA